VLGCHLDALFTVDQLELSTPCDDWTVRDVINKVVASTHVFTSFGRREPPDPTLDLIDPKELEDGATRAEQLTAVTGRDPGLTPAADGAFGTG